MCNFATDFEFFYARNDMKYAIIAAGKGSRLTNEGMNTPKPLVKVGSEHLIDRLIRIFMRHDAEQIVVICNEESPTVEQHLRSIQKAGLHRTDGKTVTLTLVVKSTPSSMHSLYELSSYLTGEPFIATTVDTIFDENYFTDFLRAFKVTEGALMGVTDYIDDERPLYVTCDDNHHVTAFLDVPGSAYVSAGIYGLPSSSLKILRLCVEQGESRMRNFQRALIKAGLYMEAYPMGKVFDIDHTTDLKKAEAFIRAPRFVAVYRDNPDGNKLRTADEKLLREVSMELSRRGYEATSASVLNQPVISLSALPYPLVWLNMSRQPSQLRRLAQMEQVGHLVINSAQAVLRNSRHHTDSLMREHHIPTAPQHGDKGYWVKATSPKDPDRSLVEFFLSEAEADKRIEAIANQGWKPVKQAHIIGTVVKFYGIGHTFFRWYYADEVGKATPHNDHTPPSAARTPFSEEGLQQSAQKLAFMSGLDIYGGDAIIDLQGQFHIIDFNDWPSFSPCQKEAAVTIAHLITSRLTGSTIQKKTP